MLSYTLLMVVYFFRYLGFIANFDLVSTKIRAVSPVNRCSNYQDINHFLFMRVCLAEIVSRGHRQRLQEAEKRNGNRNTFETDAKLEPPELCNLR